MPGCASAAKRMRGRAGEAGQMIRIYAAAAATGDALAAALCAAHRRASAVRNDSEPCPAIAVKPLAAARSACSTVLTP